MTRWLLAAEADKIQDFIFRSSRLVQVVGGSGLLARFCEAVPRRLIERHTGRLPQEGDEDIVISAGGGFRLTFESKELAEAVGKDLAEAYYRATGSSLTVIEPVGYQDGGFAEASRKAESDLRSRKADRRGRSTVSPHLPYVAFCASCGVALATDYRARHPDDEANYLCEACRVKAAERDMSWQAPDQERFLSVFYHYLSETELAGDLPELAAGEQIQGLFPKDADDVGKHDPRRYVAYLVADGNGMGVLFSKCKSVPAMQELSQALTEALWYALAQATAKLSRHLWKRREERPIPVTPLILGGDDLLALVPAPYALDFARQVCLAFEQKMRPISEKLQPADDAVHPTMSAAVVFCKTNYPYALAHRRGEALLGRTKQLTRAARLVNEVNASAVDMALIRGGDVDAGSGGSFHRREHIVPTICPYWATDTVLPQEAAEYALDLQHLLEARLILKDLPGKRRAELRGLFSADLPEERLGRKKGEVLADLPTVWQPHLRTLLNRISRRAKDAEHVKEVLDRLGDPHSEHSPWRRFGRRPGEPYAHGLPDLLEIWDFCQDLTHSPTDYEEEGR